MIVVSNNAAQAIQGYLDKHALTSRVRGVVGRVPGEPASMKPSPRLLLDAMGTSPASEYVFLGDAVRDVEAGHAAGVPTIGYANKPRKVRAPSRSTSRCYPWRKHWRRSSRTDIT
ncbi:HAD hydrolase-like protein [Streptomyces sp. B6B3]|uniref:HAD family hydrolase n=1 Tax=Streptomyces sp. B6B3 TaxID=3153570 RepID=UPI00325D94C0